MAPPPATPTTSSAHLVTFSPATVDQLLVVTSSDNESDVGGASLLRFSASNGQLLSQVSIQKSHVRKLILYIRIIYESIKCPYRGVPLSLFHSVFCSGVSHPSRCVYSHLPHSVWSAHHHSW